MELTSCGKDAKEVCTIVNLKLYQSLERLIINRAIGVERSNKATPKPLNMFCAIIYNIKNVGKSTQLLSICKIKLNFSFKIVPFLKKICIIIPYFTFF